MKIESQKPEIITTATTSLESVTSENDTSQRNDIENNYKSHFDETEDPDDEENEMFPLYESRLQMLRRKFSGIV